MRRLGDAAPGDVLWVAGRAPAGVQATPAAKVARDAEGRLEINLAYWRDLLAALPDEVVFGDPYYPADDSAVIKTMRELGITDAESGIQSAFQDVEALAEQCRRSDQRNREDPGRDQGDQDRCRGCEAEEDASLCQGGQQKDQSGGEPERCELLWDALIVTLELEQRMFGFIIQFQFEI